MMMMIVIINKGRMVRVEHVACRGKVGNVYKILIGKPEGKGPLERPRSRWKNIINTGLRELKLEGVTWTYLGQERVHW
jgi:hypothetical protein